MTHQITLPREVLEQLVDALESSIDDVRECLGNAQALAGYPRYDRRIAAYTAQLETHEAAITAGRAAIANAERAQHVPHVRGAMIWSKPK